MKLDPFVWQSGLDDFWITFIFQQFEFMLGAREVSTFVVGFASPTPRTDHFKPKTTPQKSDTQNIAVIILKFEQSGVP